MFDSTTYFKEIATQLNDIGHAEGARATKRFYLVSSTSAVEEVLQNITSLDGLIMAVEDNKEGSLIENRSGAMFDRHFCSFFLLKKSKVNDMSDRNTTLSEMDAVLSKIIARMRHDYYTDNAGTTETGLRDIDWNSCSYFTFGPIINGWYGLHFSFVILYNIKFPYDANDWSLPGS